MLRMGHNRAITVTFIASRRQCPWPNVLAGEVGSGGIAKGVHCGGMATMSFATIDVVYLLICCQTKQNKSLARTDTVRVRELPGEIGGWGGGG